MKTFQKIVYKLINFWRKIGCVLLYSIDLEVGAATSHIYTFFKSIDNKPWYMIYLQSCRRPDDSNFFESIKLQKYYQLQVVLKPIPKNIFKIFLKSFKKIKINHKNFCIKYIENNWENPTIGAYGLGWEILLNNLEIVQFTFFKKVGGVNCNPTLVELTYGLERICLLLQKKTILYNLVWDLMLKKKIIYGKIHIFNEIENSLYNFKNYDLFYLFNLFNYFELQIKNLIKINLIIPSYEVLLKICYIFNLLDSKNGLYLYQRLNFIRKIKNLSCIIAKLYLIKINVI